MAMRTRDAGFRLSECGAPVLPIIDVSEASAVQRIAELHGVEVEWVDAPVVDSWPVVRGGGVGAGDVDSVPEARLYAQLSGREFVGLVADLAVCASGQKPSVVVARPSTMSYELLHFLCSDATQPTGLILGRDAAMRRLAVLQRAAALWCSGAPADGRTLIFTRERFEAVRRPEGAFLSTLAPNEEIRRAVGGGAGVLFLGTHSIGFDLRLGPDLQICPYQMGDQAGSPRPLCLESGRCTQLPRLPERRQAWTDGRLAPPSLLRARLLALHGCGLIRLPDGLLSESFSFAASLNVESVFGAALVTWRSLEETSSDAREFYGLLNDLSDGQRCGEALLRYNSQANASAWPLLVLLGDPDYTIAPLPHLKPLPLNLSRPPPPRDGPEGAAYLMRLVATRSLVATIARPRTDPSAPAWRTLDHTFEKLVAAAFEEPGAPPPLGLVQAFNGASADLVGNSRQGLLDSVVARCERVGSEDHRPCDRCGAPARRQQFRERLAEAGNWWVQFCDTCGTHDVSPVDGGSLVDLSGLSNGRLGISEALRDARASVCVRRAYSHAADFGQEFASISLPWPLDEDGRLVAQWWLPEALPEGPLRCAVCLAWGDKLGMSVGLFRQAGADYPLGGNVAPAPSSMVGK